MAEGIQINQETRELLSRPLGRLIRAESPSRDDLFPLIEDSKKIISVGDATTRNLLGCGIVPAIQVIDLKEKRREIASHFMIAERKIMVRNKPGTISMQALTALREALNSDEPIVIVVEGEEDLLALPAVAFSPLGGTVLYGQPGEGMVVIKVGEQVRSEAIGILKSIGFNEDVLPKY